MQLRHLPAGSRFRLERNGRKYTLESAQICKSRLFVKPDGSSFLTDLNHQCEVKPVIRCNGQFLELLHMVMAKKAIKASKAA
ncbi:hypothetical protein HUZ36_04480 [Pseudoalteromonas sp. McH1-7]|uniref:hypothetical protein n=1 Tax=Pseudoalteromonas sp. McH1-7 TaxID=2745574 RepID=UPI0015907FF3|nr:hypothetical protein [Pseudoalteromonas sp. McH1-7]NUZ10029.1 hypothetical protein [Pseudoalteromonas sp. McH1-7]